MKKRRSTHIETPLIHAEQYEAFNVAMNRDSRRCPLCGTMAVYHDNSARGAICNLDKAAVRIKRPIVKELVRWTEWGVSRLTRRRAQ